MKTLLRIAHYTTIFSFILLFSCKQSPSASNNEGDLTEQEDSVVTETSMKVPDWVKNANIYEVNLRQYTKEGTIAAFEKHLPRLKNMGVDILWFMPIYPISKTKRKGSLGSYYAISDYTEVNPEHGTKEEFKALIDKIHEMGMKIILDWVPNHTGWDHKWIKSNPEWYTKAETGDTITHTVNTDWYDVADLNYDAPGLRKAMIEDMQYWVRDMDIDGFRCDVAGMVPGDFWVQLRPELEKIKPVFMLAEDDEHTDFFNTCFQMNYAWAGKDLFRKVAEGKADATDVDKMLKKYKTENPAHAIKMYFITNHDENSWNDFPKVLGAAEDALAVLAFTFDGMPLIYSGQEAGLYQRIAFFDKDQIDWKDFPKQDFYTKLLELKHKNKALWNGIHGGKLVKISTGNDKKVYAFTREKDGDRVIVFINLSGKNQEIKADLSGIEGNYTNVFARTTNDLDKELSLTLKPWEYAVFANNEF